MPCGVDGSTSSAACTRDGSVIPGANWCGCRGCCGFVRKKEVDRPGKGGIVSLAPGSCV